MPPVEKSQIEYLLDLIAFRHANEAYHYDMQAYERNSRHSLEVRLSILRGGPPHPIPDPLPLPEQPHRPSRYRGRDEGPIWEVVTTPSDDFIARPASSHRRPED